MEAFCIRQTELPHTTRLFADFTYHFDRVSRFYAHAPGDPAALEAAAADVDFPDERRAALVDALRRQNGDSPSLEKLAQPGTVAVVTGQQVGLFSGPAYTIYKALTAAKIARTLSDLGTPAVPVFWLATEDHDFAEVDHAWVFDGGHQPQVLRASGATSFQQPVGEIPLQEIPLDTLRDCLRSFPFAGEVIDAVADAYQPGARLGESFKRLLKRLLQHFDLLHIDPLAPDIRKIGAPFLARAVETAAELKADLLRRNQELEEAGYHAQVHVEPQTSLFFLLENGRRVTLKVQQNDYLSKDRRYSAAELRDNAEHLSPNALLRPVFQDYVLPTVTYVGGPAELAYLAQAEVLYRRLLGRMPVVVHRAGFTLLDQRAAKLMERYRLSWSTIFEGEDGIREAISKQLVPQTLMDAFGEGTREVTQALDRIGAKLREFDPTLVASLDKSRSKIFYQLLKAEKKSAREALRRNQRAQEEARFLAGLLYPNKHLQERLYTILPFLAKHGFELIDRVYDELRVDCPDHRVLVV